MSNHRRTIIGSIQQCQARCSCGKKSPITDRGTVEGWWYAHQQEIERTRAYLGTRTPTLKSQRDWFIKQAENPDNDPDDRALWRQLAEEIDRFVSKKAPMGQEALF